MRKLTRNLIENTLDEEMLQYQQRQPYQRTEDRLDYRNGHYNRNLDTTLGPITGILVPRCRQGLFSPTVLKRYQRRQETVNTLICNAFFTRYIHPRRRWSFKTDVRQIYKADSHRQAVCAFENLRRRWVKSYPKAVKLIEVDLDSLLAFLQIPIKEPCQEFIRRRIRTTNIIERSFREVRRRTRPMGCFKNIDSVNRIIYAIFCKLNSKWQDKPLTQFTQFI